MIRPVISLQGSYNSISENDYVVGGSLDGFPFKWEVTISVLTQLHGYFEDGFSGEFNGLNVSVGMWIGTNSGNALRIDSIITQTSNSVTVIVEDVDLYNINKSELNEGLVGSGSLIIFELDDENYPIIDPLSSSFIAPTEYLGIISRFKYTTSAPFKNWVEGNNEDNFPQPPVATSGNALAIGNAAQALAENSIAIGTSSEATGINSIALGDGISTTENNSVAIGNNGEIKFYLNEQGNLGLGTSTPESQLNLYTSAQNNYLKISNEVTGNGAESGILFGLAAGSSNLRIVNLENADLGLETAGFERIMIDTSGFINFRHGGFDTVGDANYKFAVLKATTVTSGVETWLTLPDMDELDMRDNTTWLFEADIVGKQQGGVISAGYRHKGLISRGTGANSVAFIESPFEELIGESVSAWGWEAGVSADPSTGGLRVYGKVSGFSMPQPVSWLAMIKITEINF